LNRYGEAIEADLAFRGHDLHLLWQQRHWRYLLNLILHLPRDSFFQESMSQDEELAEHLLSRSTDDTPPATRLSTYDAHAELLAAVFDRLGQLISALVAVNGGQPPTLDPWPRPEFAATRVERRIRRAAHDDLVARLLPTEGNSSNGI
jgi:hypothetical protein